MSEAWAYLNGKWLPQSRATLPLHDAGFVMGVTVTDLVRTIRMRPYRLADHLKRFREGCRAVHLHLPQSDAEVTGIVEELIQRNLPTGLREQELCVCLFATPGPIGYYAGEPGGLRGPLTFGAHTFPLPFDRYLDLVEHGAVLRVPEVRQVPAECVSPAIKQRARMHWWLADMQAVARDSAAKALLLDRDGNVTETAIANLLIVRRGEVLSPPRTKILPGVSLKVVEELCAAEGIAFAERDLTLEGCLAADEVMLSGTNFCLAGVRQIDERRYPFPGPVFERLLRRWNSVVGLDLHQQIRDGAKARSAARGQNEPVTTTPTSAGDFHQLLSAVSFAARAHEGQHRKDGVTPYVSHVLRVCLIVRQRFNVEDPEVLQAAVLHDTIEDTTTDYDDLAEKFSPSVARWAAMLSKDKRLPDEAREAAYLQTLRTAPWQVQIGKLADIYDNLVDQANLDAPRRAKSRRRARVYLDGLSESAHPEVRRCWRIVEELYQRLESSSP